MPILPSEPSCFPEDLLTSQSDDPDRHWFVLRTKPRQEKSLARDLLAREIPFYLPLVPQMSTSKGRRHTSFLPLFSSYVFLHADEEERVHALTTNRIIQVMQVDDGARLFEDLDQIQKLIDLEIPLTVESQLSQGQPVRIKRGVFKDFEGVVIKRVRKYRLQIAVNYLQQGVSVEIDDSIVEAI